MKLFNSFRQFINKVNGGEEMFTVNEAPAKTDDYGEYLAQEEAMQRDPEYMEGMTDTVNEYWKQRFPTPTDDKYDVWMQESAVEPLDFDEDNVESMYEPGNVSDVEIDKDTNGLDDFEPDPFMSDDAAQYEEAQVEPSQEDRFTLLLSDHDNNPFELPIDGGVFPITDDNVYAYAKLVTRALNIAKNQLDRGDMFQSMARSLLQSMSDSIRELETELERKEEELDNNTAFNRQKQVEFERSLQQGLNRERKQLDAMAHLENELTTVKNELNILEDAVSSYLEMMEDASLCSFKGIFNWHLAPDVKDMIHRGPTAQFNAIHERLGREALRKALLAEEARQADTLDALF